MVIFSEMTTKISISEIIDFYGLWLLFDFFFFKKKDIRKVKISKNGFQVVSRDISNIKIQFWKGQLQIFLCL